MLVDRSLQEKQRLLKRSQLQSDLSGRLAIRPGPLELITKNILQTDPQLKDGLIGTQKLFLDNFSLKTIIYLNLFIPYSAI